ncbi:MAG: hypothetical protein HYY24_20870 [Verrucomicrobia bacterium]|nr:hypothetical protein [Verrucomicrobiota bacterium]
MLKQLVELIRSSFLLARDLQENRKAIEDLRRELDKVEDTLHHVALLIQEERHEREKLALRLENALLRFERRLPPGKPPKDRG